MMGQGTSDFPRTGHTGLDVLDKYIKYLDVLKLGHQEIEYQIRDALLILRNLTNKFDAWEGILYFPDIPYTE